MTAFQPAEETFHVCSPKRIHKLIFKAVSQTEAYHILTSLPVCLKTAYGVLVNKVTNFYKLLLLLVIEPYT